MWGESIALLNPPVVSSGSGLKRAHERSAANDDEEQTRDTCQDFKPDCRPSRCGYEMCNDDELLDEWLSSSYPETHMSQKMVIE